ncbi:homoserine kinase [Thermocrinis sp.]
MGQDYATLRVPASTSNLGSGFDTFGLALNLYNYFTAELSDRWSFEIEGEGKNLPKGEENLFAKVYVRACEVFGVKPSPLKVRMVNHIPTARGLGSSATAIVSALKFWEFFQGKELSVEEKLKVAFEFEPHPDNLLPALLGGFLVCAVDKEVFYQKLDFPEDIRIVVCIPDFELSTKKAREVLRSEIPLKDAIYNIQRASLLVSSLCKRSYQSLKEAVKDRLHQPYRKELIPGFEDVVESAYSSGALAVFLSGAGPTVASFCLEAEDSVGKAMVSAFEKHGVSASYLSLSVDKEGAVFTTLPA